MRSSLLFEDGLADTDTIGIIQQDVYMNGIGAVALILLVVTSMISNMHAQTENNVATPPGNITHEIVWPREINADVDMWVGGPRGNPVGYSNKSNEIYNLLRDDRGNNVKEDLVNMETVYSRGLTPGKHCVNVHLYGNPSNIFPVQVQVTVSISKGLPDENSKMSAPDMRTTEVLLTKAGEEKNAFCFTLNEQGNIEPGEQGFFQSNSVHLRTPNAPP